MRKKIILALCGLTSTVLYAQDTLKTTTLREVIFSASRDYQPLLTVPRSATIINREVIEKSVYNSVGELLSGQEGIYVVGATQTPGTNQSLFMRGANGNQVAVMIDGKRITDPSSPNSSIDLSELSLANVERIEIVRGSHTTVFGGAAIGGVINIITKKGSAGGFHGNASLQGAAYGSKAYSSTEQADLSYTFKNGFYAQGSLFNQNVKGLDASLKNNEPGFTSRDEDDFRKTDRSVKVGYLKGKVDASVSYKKNYQDADIDGGAFDDDDNNILTFERGLLDYSLKYSINDNLSLTAAGSWSESQRINENDSSVIDENGTTDQTYFKGDYRGDLSTHELQLNCSAKSLTAVLGAGAFSEDMAFNTYYFSNQFGPFEQITNYDSIDTKTTTGYVFTKLSYDVNNFSLSLGGRVSHHTTFGNYVTFEFNPSYRINNSALLYGSISSGYNAPSLYQLYDPTKGFGAYTSRGNAKLDPETSLSLEVGVKQEFAGGSSVTGSVFHTNVKNSIEYVYLWDSGSAVDELDFSHYRGDLYLNIAAQRVSGVELQTNVALAKNLSLQANVTYMKAEFTTDPGDLNSEQTGDHHVQLYSNGAFLDQKTSSDFLQRRPQFMSNAQLTYAAFEMLRFQAGYRYAGSRYDVVYDPSLGPFGALGKADVNSYHLLDFSVMWSLSKNFTVNGKVENILDEQYAEILGFQTRGRSFYLKLIFRW